MIDKFKFKPFLTLDDILERWEIDLSQNGVIELKHLLKLQPFNLWMNYSGQLIRTTDARPPSRPNLKRLKRLHEKRVRVVSYDLFLNVMSGVSFGGVEVKTLHHGSYKYFPIEFTGETKTYGLGRSSEKPVVRMDSLFINFADIYIIQNELKRFEQENNIFDHGLKPLNTNATLPCIDHSNKMYSIELDIAIQAHHAVVVSGWRAKTSYGGLTGHLKEWVEQKYPDASAAFIERIASVANPKNELPKANKVKKN